jgi:hypothetical protein
MKGKHLIGSMAGQRTIWTEKGRINHHHAAFRRMHPGARYWMEFIPVFAARQAQIQAAFNAGNLNATFEGLTLYLDKKLWPYLIEGIQKRILTVCAYPLADIQTLKWRIPAQPYDLDSLAYDRY